ncbi:hypothetical protein BHE74_00012124 [Ensete ventricosum]|nr:hypothetical protein BHE74_00012124 [Ensete ventricosum]
MSGLPAVLGDLPVVSRWPPPVIYGMGGPTAIWAVYPSTPTCRRSNSMVRVVQLLLTDGLPVRISAKVVPSTFRIPA